jgi:hypothetical protein
MEFSDHEDGAAAWSETSVSLPIHIHGVIFPKVLTPGLEPQFSHLHRLFTTTPSPGTTLFFYIFHYLVVVPYLCSNKKLEVAWQFLLVLTTEYDENFIQASVFHRHQNQQFHPLPQIS